MDAATQERIAQVDLAQYEKVLKLKARLDQVINDWGQCTTAQALIEHAQAKHRIDHQTTDDDAGLIEKMDEVAYRRQGVLFQGKDAIYDCTNTLKQLSGEVLKLRDQHKDKEAA